MPRSPSCSCSATQAQLLAAATLCTCKPAGYARSLLACWPVCLLQAGKFQSKRCTQPSPALSWSCTACFCTRLLPSSTHLMTHLCNMPYACTSLLLCCRSRHPLAAVFDTSSLYAACLQVTSVHTILASNTSSISITKLGAATSKPHRVVRGSSGGGDGGGGRNLRGRSFCSLYPYDTAV